MKKPIIYGLTALCVLSAPAIMTDYSSSFTSVYRTIASVQDAEFVEKLDASDESTIEEYKSKMREKMDQLKESVKENTITKSSDDFDQLTDSEVLVIKKKEDKLLESAKEIHAQIATGIEKLTSSTAIEVPNEFLNEFNTIERDLKNSVLLNKIKITEEKVAKADASDEVSTCEKKDAIAELQAQVKELLKDKEEALAKIEKKKKKKEEREQKMKKAQKLYAMGMIMGQGFRASFSMPSYNMGFSRSAFSVQSPFASFANQNINPWFRLMSSQFSGMQNMNTRSIAQNFLGESNTRNRFQFDFQRNSIPTYSRSPIDAESISVN